MSHAIARFATAMPILPSPTISNTSTPGVFTHNAWINATATLAERADIKRTRRGAGGFGSTGERAKRKPGVGKA